MPIPLGILAVAGAGAAGGGGAYDLLETTVLGSDTASITFSSLGSYSDYKHLQIRAVMKDTAGSTFLNRIDMRLNSNSSAIYTYHYLNGNGSSGQSAGGANLTKFEFYDMIGGGNNSDGYGCAVIDILDFSNTNKNTTVRVLGGGLVADERDISLASGLWVNTSAVTSITIFGNFNYATNSRFSLYGIKG